MAEVNTVQNEGRKVKADRKILRVDFTPMVDMNLLLITFFMFCTTLSQPQSMDLTIPSKEKPKNESVLVNEKNAVTVILGEKDKLYYYFGKADYNNYASLKTTSYDADGLRRVLLKRNAVTIKKIDKLKALEKEGKITAADFKIEAKKICKEGDIVVMIKPTDGASYDNLVKVLDEMHICNIGKYAIMNVASGDNFLMENLKKEGALSKKRA